MAEDISGFLTILRGLVKEDDGAALTMVRLVGALVNVLLRATDLPDLAAPDDPRSSVTDGALALRTVLRGFFTSLVEGVGVVEATSAGVRELTVLVGRLLTLAGSEVTVKEELWSRREKMEGFSSFGGSEECEYSPTYRKGQHLCACKTSCGDSKQWQVHRFYKTPGTSIFSVSI